MSRAVRWRRRPARCRAATIWSARTARASMSTSRGSRCSPRRSARENRSPPIRSLRAKSRSRGHARRHLFLDFARNERRYEAGVSMKRTHLPLNGLRVLDAAARHLSFTRAADELAVTPAAVGQQIRALEDTLGVVLFRRTTRGLELTPE